MSAIGPKQTWVVALHASAFGGKADIGSVYWVCQNKNSKTKIGNTEPISRYSHPRSMGQS
jgi:hypothetical protein